MSALTKYLAYSKLYAAWLYLTGRVTGCSFGVSLKAGQQKKALEGFSDSIGRQASLIESADVEELWQTPLGQYWIPKSENSRESLFEMLGERKIGTYGGEKYGVHKGDVVLDCGSNIGVFVAEALEAGASLVIASEPEPRLLECLQKNFSQQIASGRVVLCPKGLWHQEDVLVLAPGSSPAGGSFVKSGSGGIELPVTSIDMLLEQLGVEKLDFIKMDIEGAERNALRGGVNTIKKCKPRMALSAYHLPDDPEVLPQEVYKARSDYRMHCTHSDLIFKGLLHSIIVPSVFYFD